MAPPPKRHGAAEPPAPPEAADGLDAFVRDTRSPWQRMLEAKSPVKIIDDFDGSDGRWTGSTFGLKALPIEGIQRAIVAATRVVNEKWGVRESLMFTSVSESIIDMETKVQVLAQVLVSPTAPHEPLFTVDDLRARVEPDEVAVLYERFLDWQQERSPLSTAKTGAEVMEAVEAMGKGLVPASFLSTCDAAMLRYIVRELAARLTTWTKPDSSSTSSESSPENTSSDFSVSVP